MFDFDYFKKQYSNENDSQIINALKHLQDDSLVEITYADDIPYIVNLNVDGIIKVQENTLIKKGYKLAKEIKSFF